jgi:hypothetical protein
MADITEKDEEKIAASIDDDDPPPQTNDFELISTAASKAASRSNFHARNKSNSIRSMSRVRSNNGYGCDDAQDSSQETIGDVEKAGGQAEKDPFEVHWEGGDSDPMNPRSRSMGRKWLIVIIVSASSLCV